MKALLYLLVFLNIAFFAYTRLVGRSGEEVVDAPGPAVSRLQLASEVPAAPKVCTTIGPFTSEDSTNRAAGRLGASARLRTGDAPGPVAYAVEVHARSPQDGARLLVRLRAAGVRDADLASPTSSVVALGRFDSRDKAQRRVAAVARFAVNPVIIEHAARVPVWWVDSDGPADAPAPDLVQFAKDVGEAGTLLSAPCARPTPPNAVTPPSASPPASAPAPTAPTAPPAPAGSEKAAAQRPANA